MGLPVEYRKSGEGVIASYSYTDIAEGTGIVTFYGLCTSEKSTKDYLLTQKVLYSNDTTTTAAAPLVSGANLINLDFDVPFNKPQRIKGVAYVQASIGCTVRNTGISWVQYIATIKKVSGGAEEVLGTAFSEQIIVTNAPDAKTCTVQIPINDIALFKKGDTLRLSMEISGAQNTGASTIAVWHDPAGRDDGTLSTDETSVLNFSVPFVLDL